MKNADQKEVEFLKKSENFSDEEIISEVVSGNTDLFAVLVQRYNQQLFRIVRGYLSDEEEVKDVMQSAYLKAFENLDQFRGEARFSTWLSRIAINEALKKLNRQKDVADLVDVTDQENENQMKKEISSNPEEKVIQDDMNNHLEKAIDSLPLKYRSVLILREIEHLNTKETAERLDISRTNVKVRLYRAKNMLRDKLIEMLGELDLFAFKGEKCNQMTRNVMQRIKNKNG